MVGMQRQLRSYQEFILKVKTIEEAKENLKEAIQMIIESNIRHFKDLGDEYFEEDILVNV